MYKHLKQTAIGAALLTITTSTTFAQEKQASGNSFGSGFNPKISLILQGSYTDLQSEAEAEIPGFLLGPETEFRADGFSLGETELSMEANVDDMFRGWATVAFEDEVGETEVVVEEAYLETLSLPNGFGVKFGRFFSDIGYMNRLHSHAWEFADAPLPYRAMLANHLGDDGVQLRWLAPANFFLEFGSEALRGIGFPASGESQDGVMTWTGFARVGGDIGAGGAWRLGYSRVQADADEREVEEEGTPIHSFSGDSDLNIVDFVYKWAPNGNPRERNFVFQAEYFDREESGNVEDLQTGDSSDYNGNQDGFYLQGIYQFMPRWRVGLRYDQLNASNSVINPVGGTVLEHLDEDSGQPERVSAMVDYSRSEFSRFRLQFNKDESRADGETDNQVILQYIHSIGAHPAHQF